MMGTNVAAYVGATGHGIHLPRTGNRDMRFPLGVVNFLDESIRSVIAAPMFDLSGAVVAVYMLARSGESKRSDLHVLFFVFVFFFVSTPA